MASNNNIQEPSLNAVSGIFSWDSAECAFKGIVDLLASDNGESQTASAFADFHIYAFRVPYGLEQKAAKLINKKAAKAIETIRGAGDCTTHYKGLALAFTPVRTEGRDEDARVTTYQSLIPNVMFVLTTYDKMQEISQNLLLKDDASPSSSPYLRAYFLRDRSKVPQDGQYPPVIVSPKQMQSFVRFTSEPHSNVELLPPDFPIKDRTLYKVVSGKYAGTVGYSQRIKGKDVLLVDLDYLGYLKSGYISKKILVPLVQDTPAPAHRESGGEEPHLTAGNIHVLPQPQDDSRRWFILCTTNNRQHEVAATITFRQHRIIEARKRNEPVPEDAYYGLGEWPVIAIAPYSKRFIERGKYPPRHIYLYATAEDAIAIASHPFERNIADDVQGERYLDLHLKTYRPMPDSEQTVPMELSYEQMQNILRVTHGIKETRGVVYKLPKDTIVDFSQPEVRITSKAFYGVHGWLQQGHSPNVLVLNLLPAALLAFLPNAEVTYTPCEDQ